MTITTEQLNLAERLWQITDWCLNRRNQQCPLEGTREAMFRYVGLCYLTGRMCIAWTEHGDIEAVAFCWADWKEHIELKHAQKRQQFETWVKRGDSLFVAEVVGSSKGIGRLYQHAVQAYPHLLTIPIYTYRRGELVQLTNKEIERFIKG